MIYYTILHYLPYYAMYYTILYYILHYTYYILYFILSYPSLFILSYAMLCCHQMDYINQKRAELRSHLSAQLLLTLANARISAPAAVVASADEASHLMRVEDSNNAMTMHGGSPSSPSSSSSVIREGSAPVNTSLPQHMNQTIRFHFPSISLRYQSQPTGDEDSQSPLSPFPSLYSSLSVPDDTEASSMHSSEIASPSSFTTNPSKRPSEKEEEEVIRGDHHPSPAAAASHQSQLTQTGAAVEIDLTLRSRSLSYQIGSQGYVMNRVHEEGGDRDRQYIDAETELGREVALCIEQREKVLQELQVEAALLRKAYLETPLLTRKSRPPYGSFSSFSSSRPSPHKHSSFSSSFSVDVDIDPVDHDHEHEHKDNIIDERVVNKSDIDRLQPLLAKMNSLRRATMEFADAYGAWYVQCTVVVIMMVIMMDWTVWSNHSFLPT